MLLPINVVAVQSINRFHTQHWHSLTKTRCGTIFTSDNERRYHVLWNQSGSPTVKRDLSNVTFFTACKEVLQRGIFSSSMANQLSTRLKKLSEKVEKEKPLREEIEKNIQTILSIKISLQDINDELTFIEAYPHFSDPHQHHEIKEQCTHHCQDIAAQHHRAVSNLKNTVTEQLDALFDRLTDLKNSDELPDIVKQQITAINGFINDLGYKTIKIDQINIEHQLTLKSFITAINLTNTTLVNQYLLARTTMLSNAFSVFAKIIGTHEEQQKHAYFLRSQNRVANKFILKRESTEESNGPLKRKSALEECGELFTPPDHPNEKIHTQIIEIYKARSSKLAERLSNHEATWEQIDDEMTELKLYKTTLIKQIKTGQEIATFLKNLDKPDVIIKKQNHINALKILKERCDVPGLDINSDALHIAAMKHMKAIQSETRITQFLDKSLIGNRGLSMFKHHFYNVEMQARINSLIELNNQFLSTDVELNDADFNWINESANEHMDVVNKWAAEHLRYTNMLIAKFNCIPADYSYEKMKLEIRDANFNHKKRAINQELHALLLTQHDNLLTLQERGERLKKLKLKTVALDKHAKQLRNTAEHISNPFQPYLNML